MLDDVTKIELAKKACKIDAKRCTIECIIYLTTSIISFICANTISNGAFQLLMCIFTYIFVFIIFIRILGHKAFVRYVDANEYEVLAHKFDGVWWHCLRFKGAKIDDFFRIEEIEDKEV